MAAFMESFRIWIDGTAASAFMTENWWTWRAAESLHFIGLSLLIGTVGMFDLRMMGLVKRVPLSALHRMVPWGVFGYLINVSTGILFFAGFPDQYMYNPSFQIKMMFMAVAGINVLVFYLCRITEKSKCLARKTTPLVRPGSLDWYPCCVGWGSSPAVVC